MREQGEKNSPVLINRQTGIVTVFGNSAQQEAIKTYLDAIRQSASTQVLIEAKVVEVALNEEYNAGINWQSIFSKGGIGNLAAGLNFGANTIVDLGAAAGDAARRSALASNVGAQQNRGTFAFGGSDLSAVVSLVEGFGTTRTLSSPRITVMNNQTAIMKVAENEVFFEVRAEREENSEDPSRSRLNIDSTIRTIPIGLVMAVHPSINAQADRVTLTLRPTITRVTRFASDPAPRLISNGTIESNIPVVEVREVDSVLQLQSGEVAVLGGLMQERARNNDNGLPGVSKVPVVGNAFKQREENTQLTELVIFLKAEILRAPRIAPADVRLYQDFTKDPRPLSF
jgi:general secretion pathway protein D